LNTVDTRVAPDIISDPGRNPAVFLNPAKSGPGRIWNYKSGPGRIWKKIKSGATLVDISLFCTLWGNAAKVCRWRGHIHIFRSQVTSGCCVSKLVDFL